ncbi:molybdate ABC transporter substrate-binding protein [Alteromonas facilis]|uniref:molybdate ABC transporter substrate-binding protein n=1 Tax=Alteromonas facilis TaxID=2048004 RepID=UPI000C284685|nr:molybdate ABC transporter substrate-binding protein [Alteromonas facilis]
MVKFWVWLLPLICVLNISLAQAETLRVAVAANFAPVANDIFSRFTQQREITIEISIGSTGALYAQIIHGAPFDLFLAADTKRPAALEQKDLIAPNSRVTYAQGLLAIWSQDGLPSSLEEAQIAHWLRSSERLVIANVITAPYGAAALQVLQHLDIETDAITQLVQANNVMQAVQYIDSGNARRSLVAYHLVKDKQGVVLLPTHLYLPIEQQLVVLKRSKYQAESFALAEYLLSNSVRADLHNRGFSQ